MKIVLVSSQGHDESRLYQVPDELYDEIVAFNNEYPVWSDAYNDIEPGGKRRDEALLDKMEQYQVLDVLNVCEYC